MLSFIEFIIETSISKLNSNNTPSSTKSTNNLWKDKDSSMKKARKDELMNLMRKNMSS